MFSIKPPSGITYQPIYEPDEERMVKAIKILLQYKPEQKENNKSGNLYHKKPQENKAEKSEGGDKGNK